MATYYVKTYASGGRNEAGRDGLSDATAWATPSYAAGRVSAGDHIIYIESGNYTDNSRVSLALGVDLLGNSSSLPHITTSYPSIGSNGYVYAYSSSTNNSAVSEISYIHFDGNNLTSNRAIWVGYRGNVKVHHCIIENFNDAGIWFRNEGSWVNPPAIYASGNEVYECSFINCSAMHGNYPAQVRLDGQVNGYIYNNIFDQTDRPLGQNGANIRWSNVHRCKIYNNTFYKNPIEVVADGTYDWPFFMELWHSKGNNEIYDNTFYGQHTIDIGGFDNDIITGNTFGYNVYNNRFLNESKVDPVQLAPSDYSLQWAITLEGTDHEYVYIHDNYIQRYGYGIELATGSSTESGIPERNFLHDHIYIYNNIFEDMGFLTYPYSAAIVLINEPNDPGYSNTSSNWWIVNNTMRGGNRAQNGIRLTIIDEGYNINIKNNIIDDFTGNAVHVTNRSTDVSTTLTNFNVTYNDFYSNGANSVYIESRINQVNSNLSTGNITSNPLFNSSTDFNLQSGSPCIRQGIYIDTWLTTDYAGNTWNNPPSIGAYEWVEESEGILIENATHTNFSII